MCSDVELLKVYQWDVSGPLHSTITLHPDPWWCKTLAYDAYVTSAIFGNEITMDRSRCKCFQMCKVKVYQWDVSGPLHTTITLRRDPG